MDHFAPSAGSGQNSGPHSHRRTQQGLANRSPLARLRADELYMERRKQNVQNYGSAWIKPPGVFKSLHQLREERRELEEHQEALRREQLAHELAEAEAADELIQGEGGDGDMEEARDLDDDIPEADTTGIDPGESDNEDDFDYDNATRGIVAQRTPDDMYRDDLVRGEEGRNHGFGGEGGLVSDEEDDSQILQEDDLAHGQGLGDDADLDMDINMDADLDDGVSDAGIGGYEHTDTEEELSSTDDESVDMEGLPFARPLTDISVRSDGTQNSLGVSNLDFQATNSDGVSSPRRDFVTGGSHLDRSPGQDRS